MKKRTCIILVLALLGIGLVMTGCNKEEKKSGAGLLLLQGQHQVYFPEIPQGVAQ